MAAARGELEGRRIDSAVAEALAAAVDELLVEVIGADDDPELVIYISLRCVTCPAELCVPPGGGLVDRTLLAIMSFVDRHTGDDAHGHEMAAFGP